jgi:hypothetical protein
MMIKNGLAMIVLFFGAIIALTTACTQDKLPEPMPGDECMDLDATYNGAIKEIIDQSCAVSGCHVTGGGAPGNFTSFAGLEGFANSGPNGFRDRVIVLRSDPNVGMPPDFADASPKNLTDEQLEIFRCWADAGFPED